MLACFCPSSNGIGKGARKQNGRPSKQRHRRYNRYPNQVREGCKQIILELFLEQDKTHKEVAAILAERHVCGSRNNPKLSFIRRRTIDLAIRQDQQVLAHSSYSRSVKSSHKSLSRNVFLGAMICATIVEARSGPALSPCQILCNIACQLALPERLHIVDSDAETEGCLACAACTATTRLT